MSESLQTVVYIHTVRNSSVNTFFFSSLTDSSPRFSTLFMPWLRLPAEKMSGGVTGPAETGDERNHEPNVSDGSRRERNVSGLHTHTHTHTSKKKKNRYGGDGFVY